MLTRQRVRAATTRATVTVTPSRVPQGSLLLEWFEDADLSARLATDCAKLFEPHGDTMAVIRASDWYQRIWETVRGGSVAARAVACQTLEKAQRLLLGVLESHAQVSSAPNLLLRHLAEALDAHPQTPGSPADSIVHVAANVRSLEASLSPGPSPAREFASIAPVWADALSRAAARSLYDLEAARTIGESTSILETVAREAASGAALASLEERLTEVRRATDELYAQFARWHPLALGLAERMEAAWTDTLAEFRSWREAVRGLRKSSEAAVAAAKNDAFNVGMSVPFAITTNPMLGAIGIFPETLATSIATNGHDELAALSGFGEQGRALSEKTLALQVAAALRIRAFLGAVGDAVFAVLRGAPPNSLVPAILVRADLERSWSFRVGQVEKP